MKEEKELIWIIKLYNQSHLIKSFLNKKGGKGGTFEDFEKAVNNSIRDKNFDKWFKKLVNLNIIYFFEYRENSRGSPSKIYLLNKKKLWRYYSELPIYNPHRNIILENDVG